MCLSVAALVVICVTFVQAAEDLPKYNCLTREMWTPGKRAWCCKHEKLGCPTTADLSVFEKCFACVHTKGNIYGFQEFYKGNIYGVQAGEGCFTETRGMDLDDAAYCKQYTPSEVASNTMPQEFAGLGHAKSCCYIMSQNLAKTTRAAKLAGEIINAAEVFPPQAQPQFSNTGSATNSTSSSATIIAVVVALTSLLCCILGCCMIKALCGCLFGGVEDVFDGDGKVGLTGQGEEMGLAGMAGHYLA